MAEKKRAKRVLLGAPNPPTSFTRSELRKALKVVAAARGRREKPLVIDASNQV